MTAPSEIQELDAKTVERIAAGEVVERPASAVKELVENSIDADASRVDVTVAAGGTRRIHISDDGIGMTEAALRQAVKKHTTSKISDIADLEGGVATLGFRGEALHAIGAVSRMTIKSRTREADVGTELTVEGGEITDVSPAGCPVGTTVEITDIFYNVPARRKYLKQDSTEFAHINTIVTSYALANPAVAISLTHGDRETFATPGTGDLSETVLAVYGREVAESMIELDENHLPDGPLSNVSGLVSHPETNRATNEYLSTFVNGRYVTASTVRDAVLEAYGSQLGPDRYPFAVISLELDPATVDVNVHPRKLEVRFADDQAVRDQVETVIEQSLLSEGFLRSAAPRGQSAPEQTRIQPGDTGEDESIDNGVKSSTTTDETPNDSFERRDHSQDEVQTESEPKPSTTTSRDGDLRATPSEEPGHSTGRESSQESPSRTNEDTGFGHDAPSNYQTGSISRDSSGEHKFRDPGNQSSIGQSEHDERQQFDALPAMRLLGQFNETYVVAETDEGLVLIDQHAADERIHYEALRDSFSGETTTQALVEPVRLELTAREAELFADKKEALARLGFHASSVDERTIEVSTIPTFIEETAGVSLVQDVLSAFVSSEATASETIEATADDLLADLACYPSITGNTSLTDGSMVDLLIRLDECENPYACPHGRPVLIEFDTGEIEARFERDYPGHH